MRQALRLQLQGSIIIFDEAHNLADAVNAAHSAALTAGQAGAAQAQLAAYLQRYGGQLSASVPASAATVRWVPAVLHLGLSSKLDPVLIHPSPGPGL